MPRLDTASGWRRRALRLVELCQKLDAEHVLCKAMRRWPVAALLEATEGWGANLFAMVARDWRLRKVARLLEAKGRSFTVECCSDWEPEFLQELLPALDLVTARHVLAQLYFKVEDKFLSPWECRCILEQFNSRAQRKLLRKFDDKDVSRVMHAVGSDSYGSGGEEDDQEDEDDSMDGFIVRDGDVGEECEGMECEEEDDEEADEDGGLMVKKLRKPKLGKRKGRDEDSEDEQEDGDEEEEDGEEAVDVEEGGSGDDEESGSGDDVDESGSGDDVDESGSGDDDEESGSGDDDEDDSDADDE